MLGGKYQLFALQGRSSYNIDNYCLSFRQEELAEVHGPIKRVLKMVFPSSDLMSLLP